MENSGTGKSPNTSLSFRYNANNEELEELFDVCEDDPPTPQFDVFPVVRSESASPKRGDKTPSIIDKYFKSMRITEKAPTDKVEKPEKQEEKPSEAKSSDENRSPPKEVTSSPMKEYLNRLGKKSVSESSDVKDAGQSNETWKIFHDFKFKIAQAVEDMKTRSQEDTKEKSVPRDNSISDSEENSVIKDSDQSVGDTDNQVSSLNSSIQNLSELTQPLTAKATERELSLPFDDKNISDCSDDTQRNIGHSEAGELVKEVINVAYMMDVESGVEALEDGIDGFSDIPLVESSQPNTNPNNSDFVPPLPPPPTNFSVPNKEIFNIKSENEQPKTYFFTFTLYFLTFLIMLSYVLLPDWNVWNGFLLGIWVFYLVSTFKQWLLDNYFGVWGEQNKGSFMRIKPSISIPNTYTIPSVKEHRPLKKFEGWINHYRYSDYDPCFYSINKTTTAFMKLEGCNLRLSYTKTKIAKRALWDEKIEKVDFYQHRLYNLTGASVALLPKGLVSRRHWSKKYPICITLNENEKIQVLEKESVAAERKSQDLGTEKKREHHSQHEMESTETSTSPEKKKKFVWRRRDRSSTASHDGEVGKEGLRHRLVRKMHRDKKSDSVQSAETQETTVQAEKNVPPVETLFHDAEGDLTTKSTTNSTKDDVEDDDVDETEMSRIKEFLDETELETGTDGTSEGEWSLHVKHSKDKHACLYLFGRTGRDKHEWYRRLMTAISEANAASAESSTAEEKSGSEAVTENKDGIEMAVYKLSEKETVAFAKSAKADDRLSTDATLPPRTLPPTLESYEKTFWPFLLKIIQSKSSIKPCECRALSAEVTWVNTLLARLVYDMTRNQAMLAKLQARIQRKLHTLKLPSFMSPLTVTELSLAGACPLVERVSGPTWDERGVWLDADLRYDGGGCITVLTQINLMKLKEKSVTLEEHLLHQSQSENLTEIDHNTVTLSTTLRRKAAVYDSDIEDSAESSDDDESPPLQPVDSSDTLASAQDLTSQASQDSTQPGSSKKKFLRMVDKIATNKYFQQVTDYKYVKRAMEGLSNTDIKLQIEVQGLDGRLAINLPPPPHDRVWIGFRTNPLLVLKARPAVGQRALRFAHISNWIEQKLSKEFEKILVLPNMEDLLLDVMAPTPLEYK